MAPHTRRGGLILGLLLAIVLGWTGYLIGGSIIQFVSAGTPTADARNLAALVFGILGAILGVAHTRMDRRIR